MEPAETVNPCIRWATRAKDAVLRLLRQKTGSHTKAAATAIIAEMLGSCTGQHRKQEAGTWRGKWLSPEKVRRALYDCILNLLSLKTYWNRHPSPRESSFNRRVDCQHQRSEIRPSNAMDSTEIEKPINYCSCSCTSRYQLFVLWRALLPSSCPTSVSRTTLPAWGLAPFRDKPECIRALNCAARNKPELTTATRHFVGLK